MDTIENHIQSIKDKIIREKALNNMDKNIRDNKKDSTSRSILAAFDWKKSKEGFPYWNDIYNKLLING